MTAPVIADLDLTLKQVLVQRLPLNLDEVEISFDCPTRQWSAALTKPTINLYLFDVRENAELRLTQHITMNGSDGRTGRRLPPVRIDLSYLVTTWAPTILEEHQLLWRVLAALLRELVIGEDVLQGSLKEIGAPIRTLTAQADGVIPDLAAFWSVIDNEHKPSVTYTATMNVDLDLLLPAPLVLTKQIDVGDLAGSRRVALLAIGGTVRTKQRRGVEQAPVGGAQVTFPKLGITVRSGDDGRFVVPEIPRGRHRVRVASPAGKAVESELDVPAPSYDLEV